jgi:hypothetical protein
VNFSATRSQGRVRLPWDEMASHNWRMADALNGDVFERSGPDLAADGLHVDLGSWQFHWLTLSHSEFDVRHSESTWSSEFGARNAR